VDLRAHVVGDVFDRPAKDARLLIAEKWAIPARAERIPRAHSADATGADLIDGIDLLALETLRHD
jgi:hypothetical protein